MMSVASVLSASPLVALCLGCLVAATSRRTEMVGVELERLGSKIEANVGDCGRCKENGPVFGLRSGA